MHGLPSMPPFPNPLQPLADAWKGVTRWWRRAVRPAFWGCFGGFLVAMVAAALAELAHAALGGSSSPQWLGAVTVLFFIAGGASIFFLVKRAAEPSGAVGAGVADALTDRAVRAQARRIRDKCRRVKRAVLAGPGPYRDLAGLADSLGQQADLLARQVIKLRRAARDVKRRCAENPVVPPGVDPNHPDPVLQQEFEAARATQERLQAISAHNAMLQSISLTRLERIEDLVDTARLEVVRPISAPQGPLEQQQIPTIVEEVETELKAARAAVTEVEGWRE